MPFSLRAARGADLATVEALLVAAKLPVEGLRDQFPSSSLVAEEGGQRIAAVGLEPYSGNGLLRSLFGYPRDDAPDGVQRSLEFASVCPMSATCMRWSS